MRAKCAINNNCQYKPQLHFVVGTYNGQREYAFVLVVYYFFIWSLN